MNTTFLWHDYETFGVSPKNDRPAQFAGIRTDAELNEIGQPINIHCKPANDYLPAPEACLLTGITPQFCLENGVPEYQFAAAIERELAKPETIGVGYNTIRFDDEVTRYMFWRNLIDPYAREWQNGCGRWDLLDVVRTVYALRPDGINWPTHDDGRISFKLEHLTVANGLTHEAAHDALSDVRATIALARLIRDKQPKLFDFCLALRKKDRVFDEINVAQPRPFVHISGMYGVERGNLAIVWPLGMHPTNKNEIIVWDLANDPSELFTLDATEIRRRMFSKQDELGATPRLPIKTIHANKSPIVVGNLKVLRNEDLARWRIDLDAINANAAKLANAPALPWLAVFTREAMLEKQDVDANLYGGFVSNTDRRTLTRLRGLTGDKLAAEIVHFEDRQLEELFFRYRARNFPQTLNDDEAVRWEQWRSARLFEGAANALTLEAYSEEIDRLAETLSENGDERGEAILAALYDYAEMIAPEF
ncbi:exodeoxyribonuclease I [Chitinibacter bivalviorum]|uniref:Exodeoxyribonuclease I n=1 Tax=Chitinibacter bivalviorum TaxID=2739434 RepID=A0A7H9BNX5_9NEIS|nr:exodeoxyribonuclease I [Chitinibacter bivalviorum]QLG89751.1 exodeoxyribonuclease I [Chitinibacter bivalviorum]